MAMHRSIMGRGRVFISSFSFLFYQNTSRNYVSTPSSMLNSSLKAAEAAKFAAMADKWIIMGRGRVFIFSFSFLFYQNTSKNYASTPSSMLNSSLKAAEAAKFAAMADKWWDYEGPYKPLHLMNPTRISFIRSALCQHFRKDPNNARPFEGLRIIDIGCGGGLLSEPLARMGALVTGIDAVEKNINIASVHALVQEEEHFDAVISLEVIEHVANPQEFCKYLAALTINNGAIFISTINRTIRSYIAAIVAAEYILGWLPRGTHDWSNLITPNELVLLMKHASIMVQEMAGLTYDPLRNSWNLSDNTDVNYICFGVKQDT
ncbi:ubiquinone biosynthesis O-methyltransferase, mitochondrial isoform X3 [Cryptomeria japonica]|uniref:ubiquinone biosynthesis O-methyltransferase, mitochondrial isoform X3 n=1 Tax=Cryptomeria japonica TaxID=3369 RepID=UPI0027DA4DC7|nr:ubiquinone biosynthesis O-methyltransferase, mitochondrial isoform X3 [Cryptomeria japonica]